MKALVVDDNPNLAELMENILMINDIESRSLTDPKMVIESLREKPADVVLLDISMPDIDGLTLCRQIKSDTAFQGVKVILLSAKDSAQEQDKIASAGADGFINKSNNPDDVVAQVHQIMKQ